MPEVSVEINGRKYRMACEEGQEAHLLALSVRFDQQVEGFKGTFGEIGDTRLTVMAGIAVLDSLAEAERKLDAMNKRLDEVTQAGEAMAHEAETLEARFARKIDETARRIELAASAIESAGQGDDARN